MIRRIVLFAWMAVLPLRAFAQSTPSPDAFTLQLPNPLGCGSEGLFCVVEILINLIFTLAVVAPPVMFLWGAWQLLSSGGNPEKLSGAVAPFKWTAIGFTGGLLAGGARAVIEDALFG